MSYALLYGRDAEILASYAQKCNGNAIEIGSHKGGSTITIAKNLKNGVVLAIDPYDLADMAMPIPFINAAAKAISYKHRCEFLKNIDKNNLNTRIIPIKEFSYNIADKFEDESCGLLFIDGDHSYPGIKIDLMLYIPKLKSGGVLIVHDKTYPGVRRAVREEVTEDRFSEIQFDIPDSLMACIGVKK